MKTISDAQSFGATTEDEPIPLLPGADVLGQGYDVNGRYADIQSVKLPLLDLGSQTRQRMIQGRTWTVPSSITVHEQPASMTSVVEGRTLEEYWTALNKNTKISGSYKYYSGSLDVDFDTSTFKHEEYEYTTVRNSIVLWTVNLPDPAHVPLLASAKADLEGDMPPSELFDKYGTHFIWECLVGGRVDYSAATDRLTYRSRYSLEVTAKASYQNLVGSISAEDRTKYAENIDRFEESSSHKLRTLGGNQAFAPAIVDGKSGAFADWSSSVNDQPTMIDFTEESLVPIWVLCTDPARARALENAFPAYMQAHQRRIESPVPSLQVRRVYDLLEAGADHRSGAKKDLAVYKPALQPGWNWVGQHAQANYRQPKGFALTVRALTEGSVAPPIGWHRVWDDHGSGKSRDFSCWRPIAPAGYVALGYIMRLGVHDQNHPTAEETEGLVCVHESLVNVASNAPGDIWNDHGTGAKESVSIYSIRAADGTNTGTFYGQRFKPTERKPNPAHPPVYALDPSKIVDSDG